MFFLFHFLPFCPPCLSEIPAAALWLPAALSSGCFPALTWPQCSSWAKTVLIFLSWAAHILIHGFTEPLIGEVPLEVLVIWPLPMWSRTWILHSFVQLSPRPLPPTNLTVKLCFWFLPLNDMRISEEPFLAGFTVWITRNIPSAQEGVLCREGLTVAEWAVLCIAAVVRRELPSSSASVHAGFLSCLTEGAIVSALGWILPCSCLAVWDPSSSCKAKELHPFFFYYVFIVRKVHAVGKGNFMAVGLKVNFVFLNIREACVHQCSYWNTNTECSWTTWWETHWECL